VFLIRNYLSKYIRRIDTNEENIIVVKLSHSLFNTEKDVFVICTYVAPYQSPLYLLSDFDSGIAALEQCMLNVTEQFGDVPFLLCGDMNARTANQQPHNINDNEYFNNAEQDDYYSESGVRNSQDKVENNFGKQFLELGAEFEIVVLNGATEGDYCGRFTFLSSSGNSVIDYFAVSRSIQYLFKTMCVQQRVDSNHMPITCVISCNAYRPPVLVSEPFFIQKICWQPDNLHSFMERLQFPDTILKFEEALSAIEVNVNGAIEMFVSVLRHVSECMTKRIKVGGNRFKQIWFDNECHKAKVEAKRCLRSFRRSNLPTDQVLYEICKKKYQDLRDSKCSDYKKQMRERLLVAAKDSRTFWSTVKKISGRTKTMGNISKDDWFKHFQVIFDASVGTAQPKVDIRNIDEEDDTFNLQLNGDIGLDEVSEAIRQLKHNKAAGPDSLVSEVFIYSAEIISPFLVCMFNNIFSSGKYPEAWTEALVQPVFKSGSADDPNNYRGISLLNICSKLYSYILNKRLVVYIEENNSIGEEQAGFRRDHSTIDHIYTMFAIVQKYLLSNRKLYVAFIDFKKAFDLISHTQLWPILIKNGLNGRMYKAIKNMYDVVKIRVRCGNGAGVTDVLFCQKGLKQGEILSPLLFSLFINELATDLMENGRHGILLDIVELFILLFADDVALLSYTPVGLQHQLNLLGKNADCFEMSVNLDKSSIVVFRNGGYLAKCEKWYYKGSRLEVVNAYKYLGVWLSTRLSFSTTINHQSTKAKAGVVQLFKTLWSLGDVNPSTFFKLFDSQIKPIVLYGAEIWGIADNINIEKAHVFALKKLLNVSNKTPNDMVYGETGRRPLHLEAKVYAIRYWIRLMRMGDERYPKKAYNMLLKMHLNNKQCWVSNIQNSLETYGFGYVWMNGGVQNIQHFLRVYKERTSDCWMQGWTERIQKSGRYSVYRMIKLEFEIGSYFGIKKALRDVLVRLRLGISDLKLHKLRYSIDTGIDLSCPLCKYRLDDEIHFLYLCKNTEVLRAKYLPGVYLNGHKKHSITVLDEVEDIENVARFIYYSLKLRVQ